MLVEKNRLDIMWFISLAVVTLFFSGCIAGGGSAHHNAPEIIYVGQRTNLELRISRGGIKNVKCHYKIPEMSAYAAIKMQPIRKSEKYKIFECNLPAFKEEGFVEYYFDFTKYSSYNKIFEKKVKIILSKAAVSITRRMNQT
jgi:hypothetical protein